MDDHSELKYLKIKGRVQGVGFRYFTRQNAYDLNIKGWVKNMPDGTVETLISGNRENIREMIKRLMKGPRRARVTDIEEMSSNNIDETFHDFSVWR
ncbi:MAG: acylphosphatase [Balneolaceae bacterium]|nr:acylphosphatase [Balneolaceae bacterium]